MLFATPYRIHHYLLLVVFAFISCSKKKESVTVSEKQITEAVYASGFVKAVEQYEVYTSSQGLIQAVKVRDGDLVKMGQTLISIQDITPKLFSENAKLAADFAALNSRGEKLEELRTNIDLARRKLQTDSVLYARQKELWLEGIGSELDFEQRALAFETSKANLNALLARLKDSQKELDFIRQQSKKQWNISTQNLSEYSIKSKIKGRVYKINAEPGELAVLSRPLAIVGSADDFLLELLVDEKDIAKIKTGQLVKVRMDAYGNKVFNARVEHINPMMDEKSRSFLIEAVFLNPPATLYPFLTAEANIIIAEKENALVIPRSYLINDSTVIVNNNQATRVTTGLKDYQMVEIVNGLKKGDIIYKRE